MSQLKKNGLRCLRRFLGPDVMKWDWRCGKLAKTEQQLQTWTRWISTHQSQLLWASSFTKLRWEAQIHAFPFCYIVSKVKYGHDCECSPSSINFMKMPWYTKRLASKPQNMKTVFLTVLSLPILNKSSAKWLSWRHCGLVWNIWSSSIHILEYSSVLRVRLKHSQ